MADIKVLIVVDGIFNLTTTYPAASSGPQFGPDPWFTISHLINTLRNSPSPTFSVDTASRGFNAAGNFPNSLSTPPDQNNIVNNVADPNATISGPFHFDDPSVNLMAYDQIWLFSDEGYDGQPIGPQGPPGPIEPGGLTATELAAITNFMQQGGGVFATGDHDGLGSAVGGLIPRVRFMRKWYSQYDTSPGIPPLAVTNWLGGSSARRDTLQKSVADTGEMGGVPVYYFDDQSDDIPQTLNVLVPSHPVVQGATGVLKIYPDHMHEGEVLAPQPPSPMLTQTSATDSTLSFAGVNFTEFPSIDGYQETPKILAQVTAGSTPHVTMVGEGAICENNNFFSDTTPCVTATNDTIAAYDGHTVNVGRIVTDSSFHHFLDLNLLGDPCSSDPVKQKGFNNSSTGKAYLKEIEGFYINLATWLGWGYRKFYFGFGKNNYGRDEVADTLSYPSAFYLFLEGYTPNVVGASPTFTFSGSFNNTGIPGLVISPHPTSVVYELGNTGANANVEQRIRYGFDLAFSSASLNSPTAFPPAGSTTPNAYTLNAAITIQGKAFPSLPAEFYLLGGDDPYFSNINATTGNEPYLSQDLRVFTVTPTMNGQNFVGVPFNFTSGGDPTTFDHPAAYAYIQSVVNSLNKQYGYLNASSGYTPPDTNISDPLDGLLPEKFASNGDSSATPSTGKNKNYNFAIARVRLNGSSGPMAAAQNVKVFFRLFTTQTFDTDFINSAATTADPQITYPSKGSLTDPAFPMPGTNSSGKINGCSLPFFATANYNASPTDYNLTGPNNTNNQTIEIPHGDSAWAFYGCYLNVNDKSNTYGDPANTPVQSWLAGSAHNCLVAQIAYSGAPIVNKGGVIENPENSDKLAQRNIQVTTSSNPGFPAGHRVPQTIDVRPSPPAQSADRYSLLSYPDEMMIDWGKTPIGSVATLYWPQVAAASVLQLADRLYPSHPLSAVDGNTIQCKVVSPVAYIPIPRGAGDSFAGLITVDLPASIELGDAFDVIVRRLTTGQVAAANSNRPVGGRSAAVAVKSEPLWRYSTGSFLMRIPVQKDSTILPVDENLLAILKWRLGLIGPGNRWHPVLLRYIDILSNRIDVMGGVASKIPPSPDGYQPPSSVATKHTHEGFTGKVIGIRYDRFGDFEGFTLLTEAGHEHRFRGHESKVEELIRRAWIERTLISVFVEPHEPDWPTSIILRRVH